MPKQVKELVTDLVVGEEGSHHQRDSSVGWGIVRMNNWGVIKAGASMTVVTVVVMIGAKSAAPPPVLPNNEEQVVKEPYN